MLKFFFVTLITLSIASSSPEDRLKHLDDLDREYDQLVSELPRQSQDFTKYKESQKRMREIGKEYVVLRDLWRAEERNQFQERERVIQERAIT